MISNPYVMSFVNALIAVLILPVIGLIMELVIRHVIGRLMNLITRMDFFVIFYNYLTAPGVVWHELSHLLVAIVTLTHVESVELFHVDEDSLGEVNYYPRGPLPWHFVQMTLVSCAPVVSGFFAIYGYIYLITHYHYNIFVHIILGYLIICIVIHMTMSGADLVNYFKGVWIFFILFFLWSKHIISHMPEGFEFDFIGMIRDTWSAIKLSMQTR